MQFPAGCHAALQTKDGIREYLVTLLADRSGVPPNSIDVRKRFAQYGLDSLTASRLIADLAEALGRPLAPTLAWEHPSVEALVNYLTSEASDKSEPLAGAPALRGSESEPIAIIGLACRFPQAQNAEAFWQLLRDGTDAITVVPKSRWDAEALYDADLAASGKMSTRWGGFLDQVDQFDAPFFSISPREAAHMDPQQRLMLEVSWDALEDAGLPADALVGGQVGVFVGAMWSDYVKVPGGGRGHIGPHTATGQDLSIIPARVSYALGLQGPSLAVNTACSSSLVAVHLACQSLRSGESTIALAGGVNLMLAPEATIAMSKFGGMSPDGRCFTFDARANGYVRGEGCGVVVLKLLSQALADGDPIRCVILGSAMNNDGASNGLSAPNVKAQEAVLHLACARADVDPGEVHYVEAHGTGTLLGDPIEARALGAVLGANRPTDRPLLVASTKTNIGHLESAAGIAGLIKVVLSIQHRQIPPSLNFERPNPYIPFEELNLKVQRSLGAWPDPESRALAGVSAFGFGGTNCHVVLQEHQAPPAELLVLSGESPDALRSVARSFLDHVRSSVEPVLLPELCWAAAARSSKDDVRLAATVRSPREVERRLEGFLEGKIGAGLSIHRRDPEQPPRVVFVFSGHGSHWHGMGQSLMRDDATFRALLERCDRIIQKLLGWSLLIELSAPVERSRLDRVDISWPAIVSIEIALAALWRSWGIEPSAVVGHSIGEVAAAHVAGMLSLEDALCVICHQGQLIHRTSGQGAMGLVALSWHQAGEALSGYEGRLCRALDMSPDSTVLSGDPKALAEVFDALERQNVFCRRVNGSVAAHGPSLGSLRSELIEVLQGIEPREARLPIVSGVTAAYLHGDVLGPSHWARNFVDPVLFSKAVACLVEDGYNRFLEVGPHPIVKHAVESNLHLSGRQGVVLASLRREEDERAVLLETLGTLYTLGHDVRWKELWPDGPDGVRLPFRGDDGDASADAAVPPDAAPELSPEPPEEEQAFVLPLSAKSPKALEELARAYQQLLIDGSFRASRSLQDIAYTASVRRSHHEHRLAVVTRSQAHLSDQLDAFLHGETCPGVVESRITFGSRRKVVFVFPGQGSQWIGMGRQLMQEEPVFRATLEACDRAIQGQTGWSLLEELMADEGCSRLEEINVIQPALFAIEVALSALWRSWGVEPDAVVGHSMGEVAAAHVAGALSLEDAARIICFRSWLLLRVSGKGEMALVELSLEEAEEVLSGYEELLSIAASNSPQTTILSGDPDALDEVLWFLERENIFCRRIKVPVASHSPQMDPLGAELMEGLMDVMPVATAVPLHSTVTGESVEGAELTAEYWMRNLRWPVLFSSTIQRLLDTGHDVFLEMSPHPILLPAIEEGLRHGERAGVVLPSLRRAQNERGVLLESLGGLYALGYPVDWRRLWPAGGRCVPLPSYPWQRERYWIEEEGVEKQSRGWREGAVEHPLLGAPFSVPTQPEARFWEQVLSCSRLPYLADHRVQGEVVLPGTAYVEMALAAAAEAYGSRAHTLEHVVFERMLAIPEDGARFVHVALTEQDASQGSIEVFSRQDADDAWLRHATAAVRLGEPSGRTAFLEETVEEIQQRCSTSVDGAEHYRLMDERGLQYGSRFQGVQQLWHAPGAILGRVRLADQITSPTGVYKIHPALLDACFQVLVALAGMHAAAPVGKGTFVPVALDSVSIYQNPCREFWVRGDLRSHEGTGAEEFSGDLLLFTDDGQVLAEVRGLSVRSLDPDTRAREQERWLYAMTWRRHEYHPAEAPAEAPVAASPRPWLIFSDRGGTGAALSALLQARGESCVRIVAGEHHRRLEPGLVQIDPRDPEAFRSLLEDLIGPGLACSGVLYLWSLDSTADEEVTLETLEDEQWLGSLGVLHLVQALVQRRWRVLPRVWLVTRGAQRIGIEETKISLSQAPLWGLGRVLALEHPELQCTRVDLDVMPAADEAEALLRELGWKDAEDQVALRGGARYVARLVQGSFERRDRVGPHAHRPDLAGRVARRRLPAGEDSERLTLRPAVRQPPGSGQVEVEVDAASVDLSDLIGSSTIASELARGILPSVEYAGKIAARGEGVDEFEIGQEVVATAPLSLGSYVTTYTSSVRPRSAPRRSRATRGPAADKQRRLRAEGTYLITGGLGGLGLSIARWMAEQGAGHLALMGRSGASEDALTAIEAIKGAGAKVGVFQADVSDRGQVVAALAEIQRRMPPLRGVVHAAGILDDRTVLQMDPGRFLKVLAPKMRGAWNLHVLTADSPLDLFVMYSSAVSLLGSPGQANYAAANAFLDALAHHRRMMGLPGVSINWGPFSGVGLAAAQVNRGERLSQRGMGSMTPEQGVEVLGRILGGGVVQLGVVPLNVRQWIGFYPSAAGSPFWLDLLQVHGTSGSGAQQGSTFREDLLSTEPRERAAKMEKYLGERLAGVLRLDATKISRLTTFGTMGLDSLMGLELRNRMESDLNVRLSATLLFTYPTLSSLAAQLLERVGIEGGDATAPEAPIGDGDGEVGPEALDTLTDDEAEALLEAKLTSFEEALK